MGFATPGQENYRAVEERNLAAYFGNTNGHDESWKFDSRGHRNAKVSDQVSCNPASNAGVCSESSNKGRQQAADPGKTYRSGGMQARRDCERR